MLSTALVIAAVIFIGAMVYLSGRGATNANALNAVMPQANVSSTTSSTVVVENDTSSQILVKKETPITVPLKVTATTTEIAAPVQGPETTTPTSTPAPVSVAAVLTPATSTTVASSSLPYSIGTFGNSFGDNDGWTSWWGNFSQANGVLTVGANATGTGGEAFFLGSYGWSDYTFQATIDWVKGQTFGLIARYESDQNYVVCDFTEQQVGLVTMNLDQFVDGKQTNLAWGSVSNYNELGGAGIPVAIEVHGNQGTCGINGHAISTVFDGTTLTPTLWGAIGFSTWDPAVNNSEIVVHNVGVTSGTFNLQAYGAQTNY